MSADSPRRGMHKGTQVVSPQPIVDRSIIDSVAGIINDIVPQAYAGTPNSDSKETISWARFEYADVNDPVVYPDYNEGSSTPPLLLVLGYTTGVQVWLIAATGEATEVLSWRQGVVRTLRILPNPKTDEEHVDPYELKRPLVAICDSAGPGPQFCNISFVSLKTGDQVKSIKFKNPVCDVLANKRSVVATFSEKIAVFDARTLEDILSITTCYASPGPNPNPVALGTRWLAYSEKKLLPAKRSSGGCEGEGVQSYTATVLYAAKSLGKGLRGLGETVASSLTGNSVSPIVVNNTGNDITQPGVITILDLQAAKEEKELDDANIETVIAHFTAHSDAIVAMTFDLSGALLMTADKRGHDFHVFRIQPHPGGPTLAAVHHLYILHRGDTAAKVQDMVFSSDTRWAAVSTVRGTTHVFPVAPYGGPVGVRTHSTPHVVNRLSRFHRSAGLMDDGTRSHSPVAHTELPLSVYPYSNPRLPPYPHPTVLHPLAQIRQPSSLNHANSQVQQRPQQRQRLHSDDNGTFPLKICACFAPPRAWMYAQRESTTKVIKRAVDSLFIMACHGNMIQYDLEPKPAAGVPKEKVCDDTMIELEVEAKGQWPLLRCPNSIEIAPPLSTSSPLISVTNTPKDTQDLDLAEDRWLSQVEIVTHAGPHRRLWMGPQFVFKTYNATSGVPVNLVEAEAVEVGVTSGSRPARSNPVNMPHAAARSLVPVVIDGSGSSYEQSPRFMEAYSDSLDSENVGVGENQLREDLAEAMLETSIAPHRAPGRRLVFERVGQPVTKVVNPLGTVITVSADEEDINSSQEFDSAEESHVPEPPRSVCAEEGPASLGDLEPESQTLRDLTEICAEMRSTSEPAIDSVPDENICEVKERKALCVEIAAITNPGNSSIDFGKEEAFRDVPTNLSLCVEKGEIPSSPMTQAKETAWCKGFGKREETGSREKNLTQAQYVVNCDDDSVVLMENRMVHGRKNGSKDEGGKKSCESEKMTKRSRKIPNVEPATARVESKSNIRKYVLREHEDSIVIEDTSCEDFKNNCSRRKACERSTIGDGRTKCLESKVGETSRAAGKFKSKSKSSTTQEASCKDVEIDVTTEAKSLKEEIAEVPDLESLINEDTNDTLESKNSESTMNDTEDGCKSPMLEPPDDFSSSEYHIVESAHCNKDNTFNQSDDDIEHIQSSEITQIPHSVCADKNTDVASCAGSSPVMLRKNSKNAIFDDDLEYIQTSELAETSDERCKDDSKLVDTEDEGNSSFNARNSSKRAMSSDDDLEHIGFEISTLPTIKNIREKGTKKSQEASIDQPCKSKCTKKMKDIVVIESDTSNADVTVIFKPLESWSRSKKEDLDDYVSSKDATTSESSSPLRKPKSSRSLKASPSTVPPKRSSQGSIEIINIDAMQKAETEISTESVSTPECKILSSHENICGTRTKVSRKNRKSQAEGNAQIFSEISSGAAKLEEASKAESSSQDQASIPEFSWSSIVKRRTPPSSVDRAMKRDYETQFVEIDEMSFDTAGKFVSIVDKIELGRTKKQDFPKESDIEGTSLEGFDESTYRSLAVIDELREAVIELDSRDVLPEVPETSWSSIVKKKLEIEQQASNEHATKSGKRKAPRQEKQNLSPDSRESTPSLEVKLSAPKYPENLEPLEESIVRSLSDSSKDDSADRQKKSGAEPSARIEASNAACEQLADKMKTKDEEAPVDPVFSKETSVEPERDIEPEKRSDSEQEIVPERSSSSDELNANVIFANADGDFSGRGIVERGNANNTSSVSVLAKKSNRSKRKKRR